MGLLPVSSGSIFFEGTELTGKPAELRARKGIGYVPQGREIFTQLTVEENLRVALLARDDGLREIPEYIFEIFPVLKQMLNRRGGDLSGGQQQQLAIGRALSISPKLLILDEPTAGVDVELRNNLWNNVKKLNKEGVTIILTTHYLLEAQEMCDRIAIINKGNLVALDTTEKLLDRIKTKKINFKVQLVDLNLSLHMEGIKFKIISKKQITATYEKNSLNFGEIINYFNQKNLKIEDISTDDGDLEDVFVQLTKH